MRRTAASNWQIHPTLPDFEFKWGDDEYPETPEEIQRFFYSDRVNVLKERMCDIGRRLWLREYTDGNGGNIAVRVGHDLVLCTATLICKGAMKADDICLVDMDGRQKAGVRPASSEILTHLAIMKTTAAKACVHAHPPHANAFIVCGMVPPTGVLPEPDIFYGEVGMAKYASPGSPEVAEYVAETAKNHQCIFMENHGVVVWGKEIEEACWKMENVDAYCRILLLATNLDAPVSRVDAKSMRDFVNRRLDYGMPDARASRSDEELFNAKEFAGRPFRSL